MSQKESSFQQHRLPIRVYWEDTDAGGVVYHATHIRFFERGRTELFRACDLEQTVLRTRFSGVFVVRRIEVDYLAPAYLDDLLEVETRIESMKAASITLHQMLRRKQTDIAAAYVHCVWVDISGVPKRIPEIVQKSCS